MSMCIRPSLMLLLAGAPTVSAQSARGEAAFALPAGGDLERYLRSAELLGASPARTWSIRPFGPRELDGKSAVRDTARESVRWTWLPVESRLMFNSEFPYGFNDGPVWAGRGVTVSLQGGVAARFGPISAALDPIVFVAQNVPFTLASTGLGGSQAFAHGVRAATIDLPQRFGKGAYAHVDPGESFLRADIGFFAAGLSTTAQVLGPAMEHPIILGNNAGGFAHMFAGTSRPLDLKLITAHGRLAWGRLDPSAYSTGDMSPRFATLAVGSIGFPALPGFEIGGIRFFHVPWPRGGFAQAPFLRIFEGLLKTNLATAENPSGDAPDDNQLASVFARWGFPGVGAEVYAEYGREDHNWNLRDFWQEPDHDAAFMIGMQRVWGGDAGRMTTLRVEHLNTRISHLQMASKQTPWYVHGILVDGHTMRGQALGSAGGVGGGATTLAFERRSPAGSSSYRWDRIMRAENIGEAGLPNAGQADVLHAFGVERVRVHRWGQIGLSIAGVWNLNRDFVRDRFNLNSGASIRLFAPK